MFFMAQPKEAGTGATELYSRSILTAAVIDNCIVLLSRTALTRFAISSCPPARCMERRSQEAMEALALAQCFRSRRTESTSRIFIFLARVTERSQTAD